MGEAGVWAMKHFAGIAGAIAQGERVVSVTGKSGRKRRKRWRNKSSERN
jgi:hypothetical protein